MATYAVDFETFYSADYSVVDLGNWGYTHHPEFDAYLVSIVGDDGNSFVGNPKDFDWESIAGHVWVSHNATFDSAVYERLQELGVASKNALPSEWHDTADLVVYLGCPRSLKNASAVLFGIEMSKDVRDKMKGKPWNSMTPEFQQEVMAYALKDSELCLRIWTEHSAKWPEWERQLSLHTRAMCWRGMPVDAEGVHEDVRLLELQLWKCRSKIPWASDEDAAILSPKAMAAECRKYGVEPPRSMAKDSEEFDLWLEQYGEKLPFANAMSNYRRINTLLLKFRAIERRTKQDGWMPFALKYHGAHTGRWSGDSGVNVQNMGRDPVFFDEQGIVGDAEKIEDYKAKIKKGEPVPVPYVDMRKRIKAPEGKKFVVCDLSNIEPRCMAVLGGDTVTLETLRTGADIYEAHARATMRYTDPRPLKEVDGELRRLSKARVLGLGYGCGWLKFVTFAKQMLPAKTYNAVFGAPVSANEIRMFMTSLGKRMRDGKELTEKFQALPPQEKAYWVNSAKQVEAYRKTNTNVTDLWAMLEKLMERACGQKELALELPSGRKLCYRAPKNHGGLSAETPRLGRMMRVKYHGGVLVENLTQATARDVFADCVLRLEAEGYSLILHAHDEAVCLVDEATAEADCAAIEKIMSTPPEWMPSLPQAAEAHVCSLYTK